MFGILFLPLHTLPERMAHKSHKLQFEIVAVLGLIALFTHMHIFWVAGLLLALIDLPDFRRLARRIAGSVEKIAGIEAGRRRPGRRRIADVKRTIATVATLRRKAGNARQHRPEPRARSGKHKELIHA